MLQGIHDAENVFPYLTYVSVSFIRNTTAVMLRSALVKVSVTLIIELSVFWLDI